VAGAFDLAQGSDLLTVAQSALGMTSKDTHQHMLGMLRVSDTLVKANTLANASVQQFSESLTNEAGAAIRQYNMDLEEGVAILATYADQGVKGNVAGSMMARLMRLLIRSINDNRGAFKKLNVDVDEFAATGKNVTGVIAGITKAVEGMGPAQKAAALESLGFEARVQQAILPLLGAEDAIRKYDKALRAAGGTTERVADKQMNSFLSQLKIVWNNVKGLSYDIGKVLAPYVREMGRWVREAAAYWRSLNDETKKYIGLAIGLTAVMGPLAIAIGTVTSAAGGLVLVCGLMNAQIIAAGGVAVSVGLLTKKVLLLSWAITKVTAAIVLVPMAIWAVVDALTEADLGFLNFVGGVRVGGYKIQTYMTAAAAVILAAWEDFALTMTTVWDVVSTAAKWAWTGIVNRVVWAAGHLQDLWRNFALFWVDTWSIMKTAVLNVFESLWQRVAGIMQKIGDVVFGLAEKVTSISWVGKISKTVQLEMDALNKGIKDYRQFANEFYDTKKDESKKRQGDRLSELAARITNAGAGRPTAAPLKEQEFPFVDLVTRIAKRAGLAQERIDRLHKVALKAFVDDQNELDAAKKKVKKGRGRELGALLPDMKLPEIKMPGQERKVTDFRQVALNRLSVKGLAGFRGEKKQKVSAPGVEERLDTLIETVKGNRPLAMAE